MSSSGETKMTQTRELRLPALEIVQGPTRTFYSFAVDGKLLQQFTTVSRIQRTNGNVLVGYQRPEVLSHIAEIRSYVESTNPLLPNAIVIAFDERVKFWAADLESSDCSRLGTLVIPVVEGEADERKPGLIVDGQQRAAAIREARITTFPICATAFITADEREKREPFTLVNSTKPLPKGLIYELLPSTEM